MSIETTPTKPLAGVSRRLFLSLRWKLLIGFTLLFSLVFAAAFYWFYDFASKQAMARIQEDLTLTLQGAAQAVDGDLLEALAQDGVPNLAGEAWRAVAVAEDEETSDAATLREAAMKGFGTAPMDFSDDTRYDQLMDQLQAIHDIEPRAWPYLYVKGPGERENKYIVDLWARYDPSKAVPFQFVTTSKRSYNGVNEFILRLDDNGKFSVYKDDFGQWVSAYMPVLNSKGEKVGAIGIDFEASYVNDVQKGIRDRVWVAFLITYAALFLLVFIISRMLTRPIQKLTVAAARAGEGDYEQDFSLLAGGRVGDEIGTLADVFALMISKVYKREQTLRQQVEALKIEIDQSKREKQVSEIADTEFFRELQQKARDMRGRKPKE